MSTPPPPPPSQRLNGRASSTTLELVGAFTAVCLVLYGVILYLNYLYLRWRGRTVPAVPASSSGKPPAAGGIDRAALADLPVVRFKEGRDAAAECAVCLSAMRDGDAVRALPGCGHAFHAACVDAWLCARATCPICRARPALPPPQRAPKAGAKVGTTAGRLPDLESQV